MYQKPNVFAAAGRCDLSLRAASPFDVIESRSKHESRKDRTKKKREKHFKKLNDYKTFCLRLFRQSLSVCFGGNLKRADWISM